MGVGEPRPENESDRFAEKWKLIHDHYRRPDGEPWKGTELERATGGVVSSAYISAVKRGEIKQPSYRHIKAMAEVMGFPLEYGLMDLESLKKALDEGTTEPLPSQPVTVLAETLKDRDKESIDRFARMIVDDKVVILHRPEGFTAAQRNLLQNMVDNLQ